MHLSGGASQHTLGQVGCGQGGVCGRVGQEVWMAGCGQEGVHHHAPETATEAGCTYPTGMQSCCS